MEKRILSVSEVNRYIKNLMDHDVFLSRILIRGEISNFKLHYSGHMYFTLKDSQSTIRAVMFKSANSKLKFQPENGMKVISQGRISVYERDGQYQLYVEDMQPDGIGALHIAFEQLKKKLEEEGLFDPRRKKALPKFPQKIGVVTSATGAAIRDILNVLGRRFPAAQILIYPVLVQGEQACYEIVEGIQYFNHTNDVDVIITGRGGGSIEELWAFNEEIVARCIADSRIPIVSAVGHETDFTIADFVSDMRAPTPSAAAELVVPSETELKSRIIGLQDRMIYAFDNMIKSYRLKLDSLLQLTAFHNPMDQIFQNRLKLDETTKELTKQIQLQMKEYREKLGSLCGKLDALSPLSVLARGYAIAKKESGQIIRTIYDIEHEEEIRVQLSDGEMGCKILNIVKS